MQAKIANVEIKPMNTDGREWTNHILTFAESVTIYDPTGASHVFTKSSTNSNIASSLKPGDMIDAEFVLKGKYVNIKSFKVVGTTLTSAVATNQTPFASSGSQKPQAPPLAPRTANTDERIAEQVAIKAVVELAVGKVIEPNHPLVTAVKSWASDKLRNYLSTIPPEAIKAPAIVSGKSEGDKNEGCGIDLDILRELFPKMPGKWNDGVAMSWLENRNPPMKRSPTLYETISKLTKEQKGVFCDYVSKTAAGVK